MARPLGPRGKKIIRSRETLRLVAYRPTPSDKWTLGWGHTRGVKEGDTCTPEQAEAWFIEDTASARHDVEKCVQVALTAGMFDALVSLVYNAGAGAVDGDSTIGAALAAGDYYAACAGFFAYRKQTNKATGKRENLLGLARRRVEEMALFLEDGIP